MAVGRRALIEECLWLAFCAGVAGGPFVVAGRPAGALAAAASAYALWHLVQAMRLIAYLDPSQGLELRWAWGIWREAFERARRIRRRERKRGRRQKRFFSRFRKAVAAMPDGVIILGSGGEVNWLNPRARHYFGLGGRGIGDQRLVELVGDPILRDYLDSGEFGCALALEAPGDRALTLSISVTRFGQRRERYLLVARDITRLYHVNRAQRDFSLNVSHELKTPLTVIRGYLETLFAAEDPQSPRCGPLQKMLQQTHRMQDVIDDLLMLSRLESGSEAIPLSPVAVLDMLEQVVQEAERLAQPSQHVFELSGDPGLLLLGDESLLRSAFSNLIFNAVRHTPLRTRVRVDWRRAGDHAELEVRDNGEGIPARHLPRLTERFYRVDAGRSRAAGGSGLGLAIVRQILDVHDARLLVSSEEGRGARFVCRFPAQRWSQVPDPDRGGEGDRSALSAGQAGIIEPIGNSTSEES